MKKMLIAAWLCVAGVFGLVGYAGAAGLSPVADTTALLAAIDLSDATTIVLAVGAGLASFAALMMAVRKGLRMLGF